MCVRRIVPLSHPQRRRRFLRLLRWKTWGGSRDLLTTTRKALSQPANSNTPETQTTDPTTEFSVSDPVGTLYPFAQGYLHGRSSLCRTRRYIEGSQGFYVGRMEVHETSQPRISRRTISNIPEPQVTDRPTELASGSDPIGTANDQTRQCAG